jgi:hypothetical protein
VTDPIKNLIAAAKVFVESNQGCTCWSRENYAELATLREAIDAAEARPEPKPYCGAQHPTRAVVKCQLPAGHEGHHQHAGAHEGYGWFEARPEPAAEPSEFDAAILAARKHAETWGTLTDRATINAVEALAREVRR